MADEEGTTPTQNVMDIDIAASESPLSSPLPLPTSTALLDLAAGHISGSDDEQEDEPTTSKSSTPDSTILTTTTATTTNRKPPTANRHPLTKNKSSLVSYDRDTDDEEHTEDDDDEDDQAQDENRDVDELSGSDGVLIHATGDSDMAQIDSITTTQQTIVTSDLLNVTPFKPEDSTSPMSHGAMTPDHHIFPEDADIRIPSEPTANCSAKLQKKFDEYYRRYKKTGIDHVDQNAQIQRLKDFRNPSMYEKMISHLGIDEIGTNFPPELYDPHWWGKESYYEELGKAQKLEMDRREKERRERTKISYVTAVKKVESIGVVSSSNADGSGGGGGEKRKTRFDM